ncbi:MAG: DHH family phosphoesterase [Thermoguttaceae bacterium]
MNTSSAPAHARTRIDWSRFTSLVRGAERILLTTHVRPDCDAVGSVLGMARILDRLGKAVMIVADFDLPPTFRFLDPDRRIQRVDRDVSTEQLAVVELLMVLDTSAWAQLGTMGNVLRTTKAQKIVLDHHVSSDDLGAIEFKDTGAEATGRLVVEAAEALGVALTPEIAEPLFVALATDTGWFRFASTSATTYRIAAQLTDAGAVPHRLYKNLYENDSLGRLRLQGRALVHVEMEKEGRLIHTYLTQEDFKAAGAIPSDSEDIINLTLAVQGTEVAVILVEQPSGGFKVSFRSRCQLDCSRLAEQFGGGGHRVAAGAFVADPLPAAQSRILDAVRAAMA